MSPWGRRAPGDAGTVADRGSGSSGRGEAGGKRGRAAGRERGKEGGPGVRRKPAPRSPPYRLQTQEAAWARQADEPVPPTPAGTAVAARNMPWRSRSDRARLRIGKGGHYCFALTTAPSAPTQNRTFLLWFDRGRARGARTGPPRLREKGWSAQCGHGSGSALGAYAQGDRPIHMSLQGAGAGPAGAAPLPCCSQRSISAPTQAMDRIPSISRQRGPSSPADADQVR